jgi:hypothetical protein
MTTKNIEIQETWKKGCEETQRSLIRLKELFLKPHRDCGALVGKEKVSHHFVAQHTTTKKKQPNTPIQRSRKY